MKNIARTEINLEEIDASLDCYYLEYQLAGISGRDTHLFTVEELINAFEPFDIDQLEAEKSEFNSNIEIKIVATASPGLNTEYFEDLFFDGTEEEEGDEFYYYRPEWDYTLITLEINFDELIEEGKKAPVNSIKIEGPEI